MSAPPVVPFLPQSLLHSLVPSTPRFSNSPPSTHSFPANPFTIRTSKKYVRNSFRIRRSKNKGLKVLYNPQIRKNRGEGHRLLTRTVSNNLANSARIETVVSRPERIRLFADATTRPTYGHSAAARNRLAMNKPCAANVLLPESLEAGVLL
jgi:hypothetical protein